MRSLIAALLLLSSPALAGSFYTSGSFPPNGAAGGDLTGTYPNPTVKTSVSLTTPVLGVATGTSLALGGATLGSTALAVTGHTLLEGVTSTGATGTGAFVFASTPTLVTPVLGVATGTSLALGGCSISTNAFCVTGTTALGAVTSTSLTQTGNLIISGSTNGIELGSAAGTGGGITIKSGIGGTTANTIAISQESNTSLMRLIGVDASTRGAGAFRTARSDNTQSLDWMTVSTAAAIALPQVTTGTNADFVCMSAGNVLTLQTSACTISSKRFKTDLGKPDINASAALRQIPFAVFAMKPQFGPAQKEVTDGTGNKSLMVDEAAAQVEYKNPDWNFDQPQFGVYAEDVAVIDPRLAIYEQDGKTPKSYRETALIALLIKGWQEQQDAIDMLSGQVASQAARIAVLEKR